MNERLIRYKVIHYDVIEDIFLVNLIRSEGTFKVPPPPRKFSHPSLVWSYTLVRSRLFTKISFTPCDEKKILIWGQGLAVRRISIFKVDAIFIIFCEINITFGNIFDS